MRTRGRSNSRPLKKDLTCCCCKHHQHLVGTYPLERKGRAVVGGDGEVVGNSVVGSTSSTEESPALDANRVKADPSRSTQCSHMSRSLPPVPTDHTSRERTDPSSSTEMYTCMYRSRNLEGDILQITHQRQSDETTQHSKSLFANRSSKPRVFFKRPPFHRVRNASHNPSTVSSLLRTRPFPTIAHMYRKGHSGSVAIS